MSSEGIIAVSAAVVAVVQLIKWAGLRDSWGPLAVIGLSCVGVLIWLVSGDSWPPARTDIWPIFSGVIAVTLSSAGVFGFTRATASAVTSIKEPPIGGAGGSPTIKSDEPLPVLAPTADEIAAAYDRLRRERVEARLRKPPASPSAASAESSPTSDVRWG